MINRREFIQVGGAAALGALMSSFSKVAGCSEESRPSILWLTFEDTSFYEFSCYGNKDIQTPNVDKLASESVLYTKAWSTAPQCSPARSTIVTGCYATTYGMDCHRGRVTTPGDIFFPQILRDAGYFCTNNSKTDYNSKTKSWKFWDELGDKASYNSEKRASGQPFFSVFNSNSTHMNRVRTVTTEGRRDFAAEGIDPAQVDLPKHVPDLVEMRSDYAFHLEGARDIDRWIGEVREDLEARALDEDTIVFFYSDHGGCLPRGKGYLYETGLHVPLIVHFPPKWQHLSPHKPGSRTDQLVGFVDLAPTVLSLAGASVPERMQGKAFLGEAVEPDRKIQFAFRANGTEDFDPCRAATDGRFKYIRSYMPHKPYCLRNFFQWGMPGNLAWDELILTCDNVPDRWKQPYSAKPPEALYDLENDPWELNDLSADPACESRLREFRQAMCAHIRETGDLGFFPRDARDHGRSFIDWVRESDFPLETLWEAAETAGEAHPENKELLLSYLSSDHEEIRYWGACGFATLGALGKLDDCPEEILAAMGDPKPYIAVVAAEAACYLGRIDVGLAALLDSFEQHPNPAFSCLETMTWYPETKKALIEHIDRIKTMNNQKARALLVNLGEIPPKDLYPQKEIEKGIETNKELRSIGPKP